MKILILPGASDSNKGWADEWANALTDQGHEVHSLYYEHWGRETMFDFEIELKKLRDMGSSWNGCFVLAKSIGGLLAVYAVHNKVISPAGAIFMGFPSKLDGEKDATQAIRLRQWLFDYMIDTHVIQNEYDPVTSFEEVLEYVKGLETIQVEKIPGDSHKYPVKNCLERVLNHLG